MYLIGENYKKDIQNLEDDRNLLKDNLRVIEERLHIKSSDLIQM